jgi:hypothetical protein
MAKKRLLTLTDLYNYYYSTSNSCHFSSDRDNENIVVQVEGKITFKKSDKDTEGLKGVHLQACHIDENINGSNIKEAVMTAALPSFSNRPILGYIHEVNGQPEFYGHNMHLDDDGNVVYDEVPIGIIPESCDAKLVYDKDKDKTYVEVNGYIFEEYSKAAEILEREQECSVSVELSIRELSYDAKNKYLDIEDFFFSGVTILGKTDEGDVVKPGMSGSNIKLADFSKENNSMFSENEKLVEVLEKLNTTLSNFQIDNNQGKEETEVGNEEIFEEVTEEVTETTEEVVEEVTEEVNEESTEEVTVTEEISEETTEETPEVVVEEVSEQFEQKENFVRTYEISHDDIRWGLYNLLSVYEDADNEWYYICAVYDTYFVYENWSGDKIYGQAYTKDGDNVDFDGDRYNLHRELLTDSEYVELCSMRANYSAIESQLKEYQAKEETAQKDALFISEDYSSISDKEEFKALAENHAEFSVDELKSKLDAIILDYAKKGGLNFSAEPEKKTVGMTRLPIQTKGNKKSRYGSLKFN